MLAEVLEGGGGQRLKKLDVHCGMTSQSLHCLAVAFSGGACPLLEVTAEDMNRDPPAEEEVKQSLGGRAKISFYYN